jgi:hypothetical protein
MDRQKYDDFTEKHYVSSSPKLLCQMNRNLVESTYGSFLKAE